MDQDTLILQTIEYIEEHLYEKINLDRIAKAAGYSKNYLNGIFTGQVGCTLHKYVQKRRLTEAARRLVTTEEPIFTIAYDSGYESQQAFTYAFRQLYTCTPQIYRKQGKFAPLQSQHTPLQRQYAAATQIEAHCRSLLMFHSTLCCERRAA